MYIKNTCRVLFTLLAMVAIPMASFAEETDAPLMGDVNQDGAINFFDIYPLIDMVAKQLSCLDSDYVYEADIDLNGTINDDDIPCFIDALAGVE